MNWYQSVFELIDMRSFSNLWFWIMLAVMWSSASHWVLGVPWDLAMRAQRGDRQSLADFEALARIHATRILAISRQSGLLLVGFGTFALTSLLLLGFVYGNEFSQALFLLSLPMALVGLMSISTASAIIGEGLHGDLLYRRLQRHRLMVQLLGVVSIFVTAMWGMWQHLNHGALG